MADGSFAQDLKRWRHREFQPQDGRPLTTRLSFIEVLMLLYAQPAIWATALYRLASWCYRHRIRVLPNVLTRLNVFLFGLEIGPMVQIGPGLYLPHTVGVVIIAKRVGANVSVIGSNTIGMRNEWEFPEIGDAVFVGVGARILGPVNVGAGSKIGANAVVVNDVPPGATVVGIPARIVKSRNAKRERVQAG